MSSNPESSRRWLRLPGILGTVVAGCALVAFLFGMIVVKVGPYLEHDDPAPEAFQQRVGEAVPDFSLDDTDGKPFHLAQQIGRRPMVIEFGSFT